MSFRLFIFTIFLIFPEPSPFLHPETALYEQAFFSASDFDNTAELYQHRQYSGIPKR
jgi:hypothetical protein